MKCLIQFYIYYIKTIWVHGFEEDGGGGDSKHFTSFLQGHLCQNVMGVDLLPPPPLQTQGG
jgi:hypothetical protein